MHWWQLPFSSPSKSESADDIVIAAVGSGKTGLFSSPPKLTENDADEWRSESYSSPQHSLSRVSRSSSALPQPLPLPELQLRLPREPKLVSSRSHSLPLPSPGAGPGRTYSGGESEVERGRRRRLDEQLKRLVGKNTRRSVERSEFPLTRKSPLKQYTGERSPCSCNTITPKSAPTSPYSSPVTSPQCSDTSTSYYTTFSGATMSLPPTPISTLVARPELPGVKKASPVSQVAGKPEPMPIRSQWQKGKLIGRGTFGSVYVASNRETGALCAMKEVEILPEDIKSQECMRQLEQEIKVLSNLKHPNIVQYYGSEIAGDKFYIYLEYVHPGSINKFIHDHYAAITESVVRNFTRHILCGLAYLHSTKTIHRPR